MKQILFLIAAAISLCSCSPKVSVAARADGSLDVSFKTGFSKATGATLRKIAAIPAGEPIFSPNDMTMFLVDAGATSVSAHTPTPLEVEAAGRISDISRNSLAGTGILSRDSSSASLTLGPSQIRSLYGILDEDTKAYFDMMMIPALMGETLSVEEYRAALAAMYGKAFADELIDGVVVIELSSPDGKKKERLTERLGEILTLSRARTWTVRF